MFTCTIKKGELCLKLVTIIGATEGTNGRFSLCICSYILYIKKRN